MGDDVQLGYRSRGRACTIPLAGVLIVREPKDSMALTRLDCDIFRGREVVPDASSFVAINPARRPAQMVFAGSTAVAQGLGSQVAYRLALDYFIRGVESHYAASTPRLAGAPDEDAVVKVLEDAFRLANSSVYNFGHKLSAGGRMAASLLAMVIEDGRFATARVGLGSVYLFRDNQLFPFFPAEPGEGASMGDCEEFSSDLSVQRQAFLGANSIVDVEVASVALEPGDLVCAFSRSLTTLNETLLFQHLEMLLSEGFPDSQPPEFAERLCLDVFTEPASLSFGCVASLGPEVIYCSKIVA